MSKENAEIAKLLREISVCIEENRFTDISPILQGFVNKWPQCVDERFQAEVSLIEKQIVYKSTLHDWDHLYLMKLVYQDCQKVYATDEICRPQDFEASRELPDRDVIWWCWLQGLENAPEIVKACYHSLKKLGKKIVVLTEENMYEYVTFPQWILDAKDKGIISRTHFSDLLRLELLTTRGGTWIDSTVLCTDGEDLLELLQSTPLFCFKSGVSPHILFDNWFIHCTKASRILEETKNMLYEYWKRETGIKHYFLFHLFFSMACRRNTEEWNSIPIYSNDPVHIMQSEMLESYKEHRWKQLCKMAGVHKLTYKYDESVNLDGTVLEHILQEYS